MITITFPPEFTYRSFLERFPGYELIETGIRGRYLLRLKNLPEDKNKETRNMEF